jgi:hypothetical protein
VEVSFIGVGNWSSRRKVLTCHKSLTNFITYCCIEYISPLAGFELTTLMVIGIDQRIVAYSMGTNLLYSSSSRLILTFEWGRLDTGWPSNLFLTVQTLIHHMGENAQKTLHGLMIIKDFLNYPLICSCRPAWLDLVSYCIYISIVCTYISHISHLV